MSKISELTDGGSLLPTDYLIAVRSGGNVKVQADDITVDQVNLGDNEFIRLGNSQDLTLVHNASNSIINQAGTGDLLIQKAGSTKLTVNSTGVDITGTLVSDGLTVDGGTLYHKVVSTFPSTYTTNLQIGQQGNINNDASADEFLFNHTGTNAATNTLFKINSKNVLNIQSGGDISFYDSAGTSQSFFWDASAESLGIGTTSPDTQLTLYKESTNADVNYAKMRMDSWGASTGKLKSIVWDDAGSNVAGIGAEYDGAKTNIHFHSQYNGAFKGTSDRTMSIMGNGNVGIGTSPIAPLHVKGTTNGNLLVRAGSLAVGTLTGTALSSINDAANATVPLTLEGSEFNFVQSNAVKIKVDASGRVGIGVSPTGSLHTTVKDSSGSDVFVVAQNTTSNRIAGFKILDESGTASLVMQYDNGGNVASISNPNNGSLGIYLGGTAAANLLDDYEEGNWTPVLTFGGGSTGLTTTVLTGEYTKVGRLVYIRVNVRFSAKGSSTGSFLISGLPFTSQTMTGGFSGQGLTLSGHAGFSGLSDYVFGIVLENATTCTLFYGANTSSILDDTNFTGTSGNYFSLTGCYAAT